ncbi:LysE family translocator [Rhodovibrio salinarum]|uniref:LysE family translocator n=1 Tax=Rhodovibrio salinarum TaxID=1087 RepID=A0A934UZZ0_9PROT|nr:LysE family translocator [Rhodovibrio salinarum]MBK1697031.1 LysE family translocator [Rhodovibrio salinarum]
MLPEFLPSWASLLPFLAATLALNLTPGADMTYTIARSAAQGPAAGYASAWGIAVGSLVHTLAAAAGLAALIQASPLAFIAVKWLGAAYLVYLAINLMLAKPEADAKEVGRSDNWRVFRQAVIVNLLNPKVALFMIAFLPQFVEPERSPVWLQMIVLGSLLNIGGIIVNSTLATIVGLGAKRLHHSPRVQRVMNVVSGTLLGGLAIRLALVQR